MNQKFASWFDHGAGDCCHWVHLLQLYKKRGYEVACHHHENKKAIFAAAGIPYFGVTGDPQGGAYHSWKYSADFNHPKADCDWSGNKIALNLNKECLPAIGQVDELWDELCEVDMPGAMESVLPEEVKKQGEAWLADLPRPIVMVHSHGTNMPSSKNLSHEVCEQLYARLLDGGCSIVLADWDYRVPSLAHARVRHVKKDYGHIDLMQFYSLLRLSSLLIGVDSGPYHFAKMTNVPVLGVFHHHYPSCVTLPNPRAANMTRNAPSYRQVNFCRRPRWNIIEYNGQQPGAEDIATHALRMVQGSRYGLPIGRDVMFQQWVRDWCLSSTSTSKYADRNRTWDVLFRQIARRYEKPNIVETGCIRSREDWSAGNSTYLFGCYLDAKGGSLTSIDNDAGHLHFAGKELEQWANADAKFVVSDSVEALKNYPDAINVLYLDSMDCEHPEHAEHGLKEIEAAFPRLRDDSIVVYDDTSWDGGLTGKGRLGVPWLLNHGWRIIDSGYQVILGKFL